ncbi:MAG TPA: NAD(P)-dependent alcohol dehydrogenase [Sunxiuqinia sp.]|nr:NAD(P)-dependent alcohol dehydrogenase [Sunxiuqinia sp.]
MKACVRLKYGGPEVIQVTDVDKPVPKSNEVLVKVHAATVNRTDCAVLEGSPWIMRLFIGLFTPHNKILGTDFAGIVEAVGDEVTEFKLGDKVFGFQDNGLRSHAEYLAIGENKSLAKMPEKIGYEDAAACLEGFHYAYNFINKTGLSEQHDVLVNGASGAIGSATVQLVKYFGAKVTAVCSTKSIDQIKALGADRIIDYQEEDFTEDSQSYDFVFDTVGKSSFGQCKKILKQAGIYISSELGRMAQNVFFAVFKPLTGSKKVIFPLPINVKQSIEFVKKMTHEGKFKPLIDRTYPMEKIAEAFRYVRSGQKIGNVILKINAKENA